MTMQFAEYRVQIIIHRISFHPSLLSVFVAADFRRDRWKVKKKVRKPIDSLPQEAL